MRPTVHLIFIKYACVAARKLNADKNHFTDIPRNISCRDCIKRLGDANLGPWPFGSKPKLRRICNYSKS